MEVDKGSRGKCLHARADANPQRSVESMRSPSAGGSQHITSTTQKCCPVNICCDRECTNERTEDLFVSPSRRCQGSAGRRRELVSNLHGRHHRLRAAGVRSHGNLHQMREEDERVPHLPAVCSASRARLQVLTVRVQNSWLWGRPTEHGASSSLVLQQAGATFTVCKASLLPRAHGLFPFPLILH